MSEYKLTTLHRFAYWLDAGIGIPGTRLRVGLDPILGLVPGLGDVAGALLAMWILLEAARRGASAATLGRMTYNIALDALIGAIPVLGDAWDVVWKANLRNVALLERHVADPVAARKADWLVVVLLVGTLLVLCLGLLTGGAILAVRLMHTVTR